MKIVFPVMAVFLMLQSPAQAQLTEASFYTRKSLLEEGMSGYTANGEYYREDRQTCAHPYYPFGTILTITNPENGRWYDCRVNDRGPAAWTGHGIDLTPLGFDLLKIPRDKGTAMVRVERKK